MKKTTRLLMLFSLIGFVSTSWAQHVKMGESVIGKSIRMIELKTVQESKNSGDLFYVVVGTLLNDGTQILSTPTENPKEEFGSGYILSVQGAKKEMNGIYSFGTCSQLENGYTIVKIKRADDSQWLKEVKLKVNCTSHVKVDTTQRIQQLFKKYNYWSSSEAYDVKPSPTSIYTFRKVDTIQSYYGAFKNMAILKTKNHFLRATNYTEDEVDTKTGTVKNYGFELNTYSTSAKKLQSPTKKTAFQASYLTRPAYSSILSGFVTQHSGATLNSLQETSSGFVLCGIDMLIIYDKAFHVIGKIQNKDKTRDKYFLDVKQVGNSTKYLYTFISLSDKSHSKGAGIYIQYFDTKTQETSSRRLIQYLTSNHELLITPQKTKLFIIDAAKGDFFLTYNSAKGGSNESTELVKGNLNMFDDYRTPFIWKKTVYSHIFSAVQTKDNKIQLLLGGTGFDEAVKLNELDPTYATAAEMVQHAKSYEEIPYFNSILNVQIYPQKNGDYIVFGSALENSSIEGSYVIYHYNSHFNLKGVYRFGLPYTHEIANSGFEIKNKNYVMAALGYADKMNSADHLGFYYHHNRHAGRIWNTTYDSWEIDHGEKRYNAPGVHFNAINLTKFALDSEYFFANHTAFDFILEGNILYIMTPFAIMKTDITNVTGTVPPLTYR